MSEGFSFLGFRIQWRRKQGTAKWYVYTFIDDRPVRSLKAKIRALTRRTSQLDPGCVLTSLNQVMHGAGLTTSGTRSPRTSSACWTTSPGGE